MRKLPSRSPRSLGRVSWVRTKWRKICLVDSLDKSLSQEISKNPDHVMAIFLVGKWHFLFESSTVISISQLRSLISMSVIPPFVKLPSARFQLFVFMALLQVDKRRVCTFMASFRTYMYRTMEHNHLTST